MQNDPVACFVTTWVADLNSSLISSWGAFRTFGNGMWSELVQIRSRAMQPKKPSWHSWQLGFANAYYVNSKTGA